MEARDWVFKFTHKEKDITFFATKDNGDRLIISCGSLIAFWNITFTAEVWQIEGDNNEKTLQV